MLYEGQRIASELVIFHHIGPRNSTQVNQDLVYFGPKYNPYSFAFFHSVHKLVPFSTVLLRASLLL